MYRALDTRYDGMTYRRCGRSGLQLPAVSLGLWHNFGGVDRFDVPRRWCGAPSTSASRTSTWPTTTARRPARPERSADLRRDLAAHRDELIVSTKAGYVMGPGRMATVAREISAGEPGPEP